MPIETEIKGSPASIRQAGTWLGGTVKRAVGRGGDAMLDARREAGSEWLGETGASFADAMSRGVTVADQVERSVGEVRTAFDDYAGSLERCQNQMAGIREDARGKGLTVAGFTIQEPGAGPARPGNPPETVPQGQVDAYNADVAAYNDHQDRIRGYNELVARAEEVWNEIERAWERVSAKDRALDGANWAIVLTDIAGGLTGAALNLHGSILSKDADYFARLAQEGLDRLRGSPRVPNAAQFYDDLDRYSRLAAGSADDAARASRFLTAGKALPLAAGGLLTGVGIWYDMESGGESAEQAVVSNVGGFAASVATGAVVGTAIGGPVGLVVGTGVGAGVGVFTSGMIDGLWDSGDVTEAFGAGVDTLVDTGGALVDGASDVGGAIVDGIGGLFD